MLRRLLLVGFAVLVPQGTVTQLVFGFLVSFVYLLVQVQAKPYVRDVDDYLATACSASLVLILFISFLLKMHAVVDLGPVHAKLSDELKLNYAISPVVTSAVLIAVLFGVLLTVGLIALQQVRLARQLAVHPRR